MRKFVSIIILILVVSMGLSQISCTDAGGDQTTHDTEVTTTKTQTEDKKPVTPTYISSVPKAKIQAKSIYTVNEPDSFSDKLALASLQGLVANKCEDQILIKNASFENFQPYFFSTWKCRQNTTVDSKSINLENLIAHYKDNISGYILCSFDEKSESGSVAVSLAGLLDAIVVTPTNKKLCEKVGLTCLLDATNLDDAWLRSSEYFDQLNKDIAFEQATSMAPKLVDYAVMSKSYFNFYNGNNANEHAKMFEFLNDGAIVFGYNNTLGEYHTVLSFSKENIQMVPADHAYNLSTLSGFTLDTLTQKTEEVSDKESSSVHTVCVVLSDGDNLQWMTNDFTTSNKWWSNQNRGKFAMGWGIPATMIDVAPVASKYLYSKMTKMDEFIVQLSGLGYTFPSKWSPSERDAMAKTLAEYMKRVDASYAEILDDKGFNKETLSSFTKQDGIDGLFYIDYSNYAGMSGKILWSDGKPIVSARYRLWADVSGGSIEEIANSINAASTDPTKASSYSFIIVHAWSGLENGKLAQNGNTMDAVAKLVQSLGTNVEVVTPTEFMNRIVENNAK